MSKTCIITCTAGDFEAIDEWIQYHHNLGVELFLIGYNGQSDKFRNYRQYDYVKYIDFSYNNTNEYIFKDTPFESFEDRLGSRHMKIANILLEYVRTFYYDYNYCFHIDTDEYMCINNYSSISDYFDNLFNDNSLIKLIWNRIYSLPYVYNHEIKSHIFNGVPYDDENTYYIDYGDINSNDYNFWKWKFVLNLKHNLINTCKIDTPHTIVFDNFNKQNMIVNYNDGYLAHFVCDTLENFLLKRLDTKNTIGYRNYSPDMISRYFWYTKYDIKYIYGLIDLFKKYDINDSLIENEPDYIKNDYYRIKNGES